MNEVTTTFNKKGKHCILKIFVFVFVFFFRFFVIKDGTKKGDLLTVFDLHNGFEITYL